MSGPSYAGFSSGEDDPVTQIRRFHPIQQLPSHRGTLARHHLRRLWSSRHQGKHTPARRWVLNP
ncbi:hypothetical protein [Lysobacter gummosus]|uniref:hypothetical protein n=1 Tax=Lysobacter gummosus TaxID=262324 RepID=UPI00362B04BB